MKKSHVLTIFLIMTVAVEPANAELEISGYYKNFSISFDSPLPDEALIGAVNNRLRLNSAYAPADAFSFDLSYDFGCRIPFAVF